SRPSQALFAGLAVFFSFVALFAAAGSLSIAELIILWLGTMLFVRYGVKAVFHQLTYHRGIWHSLLAAVFASFVTAAVFYWLLKRHDGVAWLGAGFMFIGFLTHLILDEMYSVDVMDQRIKASFGTALKLADSRKLWHTGGMIAATALVWFATPPTKTFSEGISSRSLWAGIEQKLLPQDRNRWFGVDVRRIASRPEQSSAAPIVTGSNPVPSSAPAAEPTKAQ
ncbi:MAG: hypothetical protein RL291_573, partial [Pseudomonadota bacterium]